MNISEALKNSQALSKKERKLIMTELNRDFKKQCLNSQTAAITSMKKVLWIWGLIPLAISLIVSASILGVTWYQYHEMTGKFKTLDDGSVWTKTIKIETDNNGQAWALLKKRK